MRPAPDGVAGVSTGYPSFFISPPPLREGGRGDGPFSTQYSTQRVCYNKLRSGSKGLPPRPHPEPCPVRFAAAQRLTAAPPRSKPQVGELCSPTQLEISQ